VKPDELITRIDSYTRIEPKLQVLRLAHRFGRGPQAHITKLPLEIEQAIEDLIIKAEFSCYDQKYRKYHDIRAEFACYESRCAPSHHCEDLAKVEDAAHELVQLCGTCADDEAGFWGDMCNKRCNKDTPTPCNTCKIELGDEDCERSCRGLWQEIVEDSCMRSDDRWGCGDEHESRSQRWVERVMLGGLSMVCRPLYL